MERRIAGCSWQVIRSFTSKGVVSSLLLLLKLVLQHLTVVFHALDVTLGIRWGLLRSSGIDIAVSEDVGRHCYVGRVVRQDICG
jgi:hypothetical protein